jgi:bacterioferritin
MQGNKAVIAALNEILTGELTAINQYFLHARMCSNWGYERIAKTIYHESIDEMKHAQNLIDRVLFLEGLPNLQKLDPLNIGQTVVQALKADLGLEQTAIPRVRKGIELAYQSADHGTRELLEKILVDEEKHVDWLEAQLSLVEQVGEANYLAQQIHKKED